MSQPFKHPKTGVYYYRRVVPEPLRAVVGKREEKRTLGTKDPREAKIRHAEIALEVERYWAALSAPPVSLTNKEIVALSGVLYRDAVERFSEEPGPSSIWQKLKEIDASARDQGKLERWYGQTVDELLLKQGLNVDQATRDRLLRASSKALLQAIEQLQRNSHGDYKGDPEAERFPDWNPRGDSDSQSVLKGKAGTGVTITDLLEKWWKEGQASGLSPKTYQSYSGVIARFVKFLKHNDPSRVTPENVVSYKDARLEETNPRTGKKISPKTIKDSDLAALKTIFGWAKMNLLVPSNPAEGISLKVGKSVIERPKGFTDDEARALLDAADKLSRGSEREKTYLAKRWIPWICAYTGSRVGEVAQLRTVDVRQVGDSWVITLTPEAGTIKGKAVREVVVHEHLIDRGFADLIKRSTPGYLFVSQREGDEDKPLGLIKAMTNRLREFARETVADTRVQPNHGWRHRFKTIWREQGLDPRICDAIQGHSSGRVADDYGDVTIKAQAQALAKFPRQI